MDLKKSLNIILLLLILQSCVLSPPYSTPFVDTPEQWRFTDNNDSTFVNIRWWDQFEDPVLSSLICSALEYNNDIKVAIYRVAEFYALYGIARSRLFPQIFGEASASKQETSLLATPIEPDGKLVNDFFSAVFNASYEVDVWGKIRSLNEAALADLMASIEARRVVVLMIVTSIAAAYVEMREFDRELTISIETLKSREESFKLAKLRFEEGFTSELEVKQAESEVENAAAAIVDFELLIAERENLISVLAGRFPSSVDRGLGIREWPEPFEVPAGLPSELLKERPDIRQAEQELIASNARIGVAMAEYYPDISLTGFIGWESLSLKQLGTLASRMWMYGSNALQPLFTGGRIASTVLEFEAINSQAYYNYERVVLNAFQEVENSLIRHQKAKESRDIQRRRVKVVNDYLKLATLQYNNGQTDYLNVLDSERNFFAAQLDLAQAQASVFLSLIEIYGALGGGWVIDADRQVIHECEKCNINLF